MSKQKFQFPQQDEGKTKDRQFVSISSANSVDGPVKPNQQFNNDSGSDKSDLKFYIPPPEIENLDASINSTIIIVKESEEKAV